MEGWEAQFYQPYGEEFIRASGPCGASADEEGQRHVVSAVM